MKSEALGIDRPYSTRLFHLFGLLVVCVAFASAGIVSTHASADAAGNSSTCGPTIAVAPSPSLNATASWLNGVGAVSDANVWAVGAQVPIGQKNQRTLIEHWNGTGWAVQPSGNEGASTTLNELSAISVVSARNIWAVGDHGGPAPEKRRPLIEHWNGSSWHITPSPDLGSGDHFLTGVTAVSPSDVWAVGWTGIDSYEIDTPIAEHWNGSVWSVVTVPIPPTGTFGPGSEFYAVSGSATSDVWAVGLTGPGNAGARPLVEHWNGSRWTIVTIPTVVSTWNNQYLEGVSSKATSDVWVVGTQQPNLYNFAGLVEHWNGNAWTVIPSADPPGSSSDVLHAVSEVSNTDVWAVGNDDINSVIGTLVEHWNGSAWSVVPSPTLGTGPHKWNQLSGVAALPQGFVWTAGQYEPTDSSPSHALIEQQCG
jgi:hypothetical protein